MSYLDTAKTTSKKAHTGQKYTAGKISNDYFDCHIEGVVKIAKEMGYKDKVIASAYLHDVIEDTNLTANDLLDQGIPNDVVEAVVALSMNKEKESKEDYIARVVKNKLAIPVKYADSMFNLETTLNSKADLTPERYQHLKQKYESNLAILEPLLPSPKELK